MKWTKISIVAFGLFFLSGCVVIEEITTTIKMDKNKKSASITEEYKNISSDKNRPKQVKADFEIFLGACVGDEFIRERAGEGVLVKSRSVYIEDEKVIFRTQGLVEDINDLIYFLVGNGERIMLFEEAKEYEIIETNGKIWKTDKNTFIIWPFEYSELRWKVRIIEKSKNFEKNQKIFTEMTKKYLDENKLN